jgi:hypothetical protein
MPADLKRWGRQSAGTGPFNERRVFYVTPWATANETLVHLDLSVLGQRALAQGQLQCIGSSFRAILPSLLAAK